MLIRIRDLGSGIFMTLDPGSGKENFGSGLKNFGSATLPFSKGFPRCRLWLNFSTTYLLYLAGLVPQGTG
jgi:hypothetical protein